MPKTAPISIPYCGAPPVPGELWARWNLDPILLAALLAAITAYVAVIHRSRDIAPAPSPRRQLCTYLGWSILALSLVSPLCNLSVALSAARIGQHMLITLVAVPLLVLGRIEHPVRLWLDSGPRRRAMARRAAVLAHPPAAATLYTIFLWLWHTPYFYDATFKSTLVYWAMHLTMIGSALALWRALLSMRASCLSRLFWSFAASMQMTVLGALLAFSRHPWFDVHANATRPWGFAPIEDQQLAGLIMWVPGGAVFLAAALAALVDLMRRLEEHDTGRLAAPTSIETGN